MEQNLIDIYDMIEHAIDYAFDGRMNLKFYDYLKTTKIKKHEIDAFIESTTAAELSDLTLELEEYLKGGADSEHKQLREGYGHIPVRIVVQATLLHQSHHLLKDCDCYDDRTIEVRFINMYEIKTLDPYIIL